MSVSTTVVSTRSLRPRTICFSHAIATTRAWICWMTSGPSARASLPSVFASGTFCAPTRVNSDTPGSRAPRARAPGSSSYAGASRATAAAPPRPGSPVVRVYGSGASVGREPRRQSAPAHGQRAAYRRGASTLPTTGLLPPGSGPRRRTVVDARARSSQLFRGFCERLARTSCFSRSSELNSRSRLSAEISAPIC